MVFRTYSELDTEQLGERLAPQLPPGTVIAYEGDLGAGKTAFTRGIARGLGIQEAVTSPTYNIVNEYSGIRPLFHFDVYRLSSADDLFDIGWDEYVDRNGIIAVEWSSIVADALENVLHISIQKCCEHENERLITIEGGATYAHISL